MSTEDKECVLNNHAVKQNEVIKKELIESELEFQKVTIQENKIMDNINKQYVNFDTAKYNNIYETKIIKEEVEYVAEHRTINRQILATENGIVFTPIPIVYENKVFKTENIEVEMEKVIEPSVIKVEDSEMVEFDDREYEYNIKMEIIEPDKEELIKPYVTVKSENDGSTSYLNSVNCNEVEKGQGRRSLIKIEDDKNCVSGPFTVNHNVDFGPDVFGKRTEKNTDFNVEPRRYGRSTTVPYLLTQKERKGTFICDHCGYITKYKSDLQTHIKIHKSEMRVSEKPYVYSFRKYGCSRRDPVHHHMLAHSDQQCNSSSIMCHYKYTKRSYMKHLKFHSKTSYECSICEAKIVSKKSLMKHLRNHITTKRFICDYCGYRCKEKYSLVSHIRTHTGEKPYSCRLCTYRSVQKVNLEIHMRKHAALSCKECMPAAPSKVRTRYNLIMGDAGELPYDCNLCLENGSLLRHFRNHVGETIYSCKFCEYRSNDPSIVTAHMKSHSSDKQLACKVCHQKFFSACSLNMHMRLHYHDKLFSCRRCQFNTSDKFSLKLHMKTHGDGKPFTCDTCKQKYANKSTLLRHIRLHNNERVLSCSHCDYKCVQKNHFSMHMKKHNVKKMLFCKLCEYKCLYVSDLVKHIRCHIRNRKLM